MLAEIEEINSKLRGLEAVREIQLKIDQAQSARENILNQIETINSEIKNVISKEGPTIFAVKAAKKVKKLLDEKRNKGEIPSNIKKQFVEDLIARGECICSTKLIPGSKEYNAVLSWKEVAVSQEIENAFIEVSAWVNEVLNSSQRVIETIRDLVAKKEKLSEERRKIDGEIQDLKEMIREKGKEVEDIGKLNKRKEDIEQMLREISNKLGIFVGKLEFIENQIYEKEKELNRVLSKEQKGSQTTRQIETCERIINVLKQILEIQSQKVKEKLQQKIDEVYRRFLRKNYQVKLSDNYNLMVVKDPDSNYNVGLSQGERQITSLSFIGAIVDLAREQLEKDPNNLSFPGGIYPIVMDSPFGALDSDHRKRIALGIPELAHQIVVIVSTSQWRGEVESAMKSRIGKQYILKYHDPKKEPGLRHEYTEIKEVSNVE